MTAPKDKAVKLPRARTDWDAVERDYRTGQFTLRELEAKHGAFNSSIARKAKSSGWTQDLSGAIRQATNAKLAGQLVSDIASKCAQDVSSVVAAAANQNTRIVLGHRTRLTDLADAVDQAKAKLLSMGDTVADIREAATFVQAVGNLAASTKTLIEQERKAHNLDTPEADGDEKAAHTVKVKFV